MNLHSFIEGKKPGFWVTVGLIVLSIVTAITYVACFTNTDEMNYFAFAFLLIGAVAGIGLIAFKKYTLATYVVAGCVFVALLFYIYAVYYYVSVVLVGIDEDHFSTEFIICTILFAVTFIGSLVDVFLGQTKEISTEVKEEIAK